MVVEQMKLDYYKSDKGIYVARSIIDYLNRRDLIRTSGLFKINNKLPQKTHHASWVFIEGETELKTVSFETKGETYNYHWTMKENTPDVVAKLIPKTLTTDEASEYYDDDEWQYYMSEECMYFEYRSFYERVWDTKPDYFKDQEIEVTFLGDISSKEMDLPSKTKYSVYKTKWKHEGTKEIDLSGIASYSELSQMLTSDLLIHNQACSLTSVQTYNIIRTYVNNNIDPKWATVTSDYDFCFTVKKKIAVKPIMISKEQTKSNGKSYAKPRFTTNKVTHKLEQVFEMTHAERRYKGYTSISGFKGDSLQELADTVEQYLEELITYINKPLSECSACEGTGHLFDDYFEANKR